MTVRGACHLPLGADCHGVCLPVALGRLRAKAGLQGWIPGVAVLVRVGEQAAASVPPRPGAVLHVPVSDHRRFR